MGRPELHGLTREALHHVAVMVGLKDEIDVATMERALAHVVDEQPGLRGKRTPRLLTVRPERGRDVLASLVGWAYGPFDPDCPPMLKVCAIQAGREQALGLVAHRDEFDHTSLARFGGELMRAYQLMLEEGPPPAAEDGIGALAEDPELVAARQAYERELQGASLLLDLPRRRPPTADPVQHVRCHEIELPAVLARGVSAAAARESVAPGVVYLAAFQALLHRYTRQEDVVIGVELAHEPGAHGPGDRGLGNRCASVPMRSRAGVETTFGELLRSSAAMAETLRGRRTVPVAELSHVLSGPDRHLVEFAHRSKWLESGPGWRTEILDLGVAEADLSLLVCEEDRGTRIRLAYSQELIDPDTARRLAGHYLRLLEQALAAPDRPISGLRLLGPDDEELLAKWAAAPDVVDDLRPVFRRMEEHARVRPHAVAATRNGQTLSYGALDAWAGRVAEELRESGAGRGSRVALCMERSLELMASLLGVHKAGAIAVLLDPKAPDERLAQCVRISGAECAISIRELTVPTTAPPARPPSQSVAPPGEEIALDELSHIVFTSGSTGEPKAVALPHRAVAHVAAVQQVIHSIGPDDSGTWLFPPSSSASASVEIWPYLAAGAGVHIADQDVVTAPPRLFEWLLANDVTHTFVSTPVAELLFTLSWPDKAALRLMLIGGDRVRRWPAARLPFEVANWYGCAEGTAVTTSVFPWPERLTSATATEEDRLCPPPIGRPVPGVRIYLVDDELRPVPPGAVGELCVAGPELARGYLRAAQTAERFLPDPFSGVPGARMYRTGDLARFRPDGVIMHCGRADQQVKIRGNRVEVGDIEAAVMAHPAVAEAVVVVHTDEREDKRLVGYVVLRGEADQEVLRAFLSERLPGYMVPAALMILDAIPYNAHGKVDRNRLPEVVWSQDSERAPHSPPTNPLEQHLTEIWNEALGVDGLGIEDNFFLLGGDSLIASKAVSRIRDVLGADISVRDFVVHPTPREMAAFIGDSRPGEAS